MDDKQRERWNRLEPLRTHVAVPLSPVTPVIHVTPLCGPNCDLVMVNFYDPSHFLTADEAMTLAEEIRKAATITQEHKWEDTPV